MHRLSLFLLLLIVSAASLVKLEWDEEKVALSRWGQALSKNKDFQSSVARECTLIVGTEQSDMEAEFLRSTKPIRTHGVLKRCEVRVGSSHSSRFHLQSFWNFSVEIATPSGAILEDSFPITFALPLAVLPLIAWCLATILSVPLRFGPALLLFLVLGSGMNPARITELTRESMSRLVLIDSHIITVIFLLFWALALKHAAHVKKIVWPSTAGILTGLWNPIALSGVFPLQYPGHTIGLGILEPVLCATLSTFFLSAEWDGGLFTPRYFAIAVIFFVGFRLKFTNRDRVVVSKTLFIRSGIIASGVILMLLVFPNAFEIDPLLAMAASLLGAALLSSRQIDWRGLFPDLLRMRFVALGLFAGAFTITSGLSEVLLAYWAPKEGMSALSTFLSGLSIGFLTGNFSYSYFQVLPEITRSVHSAVVEAALIDGVTAGTLLSPFHPLFLATLAFLKPSDSRDSIVKRATLVLGPLVIALVVFGLDALGGISILMPMTFTFLTLLIGAIQLRKRQWSLLSP